MIDKESRVSKNKRQISNHIFFIILTQTVVIISLVLFLRISANSDNQNDKKALVKTESESIPRVEEDYSEYIEVPVMSPIVVSQKNPYFELHNPKNNTVYMGFEIYCENEIVYQSQGVVEPSKFVNWNVYDTFKKKGNYDITIVISTYDIETEEHCSSANISSIVSII